MENLSLKEFAAALSGKKNQYRAAAVQAPAQVLMDVP